MKTKGTFIPWKPYLAHVLSLLLLIHKKNKNERRPKPFEIYINVCVVSALTWQVQPAEKLVYLYLTFYRYGLVLNH